MRPVSPARSALALSCALAIAPLAAQTAQQAALQVTATVATAPPAIAFAWPADAAATGYRVARRAAGATAWGPSIAIPGAGAATSWTDAAVAIGQRYEYWFTKTGTVAARGLVTAGIEAALIDDRGVLVLLVDATQAPGLGTRLDRLIEDLTGDGWSVVRHDVPRTEPVPAVKARIRAEVAARPGQVRCVFLLGHVPVPYSGAINPDGHGDHYGAWPADVYYGELDGAWTDASVNTTVASRPANRNVPLDGKFDQSAIPSDVDLAVGRVDLADMPAFALAETALLQQYLDKDHDYRHAVLRVEQRAIVDDNFGWFGGEAFAATGWRNFPALVGPANVTAADYFTTLNTATGNGWAWSCGCGGGSYQSAGGIGNTADFAQSSNRNVFTVLFGSYFGDWDTTNNFLRAPLCSGWTLCDVWAGRPHWSFHPMGLGATIGECARLSQNDTTAGGFGTRWVHMALMGDPTLRQHVVAPPDGVAVASAWPQAIVSWNASPDAVAGYHIHRAASRLGPFTRLTAAPVQGLSFTDQAPPAGESTWMVRAVRLETTPTGSYWNASQGAFATARLPDEPAAHTAYGEGCYAISDSFYEFFATPAAASAALGGTAVELLPQQGGWLVQRGGSFVAPGAAATALVLGDDTAATVVPTMPVRLPDGSTAAALQVHSNGIVAAAPLSMTAAASAAPGVPAMLGENAAAWYSWHDFDPTEPGSGSVLVEETGGTLYVTWDGVESHPAAASNPSTQQFQFELATGVVRIVWPALTATGTGQPSAPSEQWLVGWSPGGPSLDTGPLALASALPARVAGANTEPLHLSASPAPVSTPAAGTVVTYAIDHVPELSPGSRLGLVVFSFAPDLAGTPLAAIGMPGCTRWVAHADATRFFGGSSASQAVPLAIPPGIPGGATLFATAVALVPPNGLPNGQNPLGAVVSNGVRTFVNDR